MGWSFFHSCILREIGCQARLSILKSSYIHLFGVTHNSNLDQANSVIQVVMIEKHQEKSSIAKLWSLLFKTQRKSCTSQNLTCVCPLSLLKWMEENERSFISVFFIFSSYCFLILLCPLHTLKRFFMSSDSLWDRSWTKLDQGLYFCLGCDQGGAFKHL